MIFLKKEDIESFRARFHSFYDGVIRSIMLSYRNSTKLTEAAITVSVRDVKGIKDDGWVNVHLKLIGITEFTLHESDKDSYQVLSSGIHILYFGELFLLEFGSLTEEPRSLSEAKNSKFYFLVKQVEWEVTHYQE